MLTAERAREILDYDQNTGVIRWRKSTYRKGRPGAVAGSLSKSSGYVVISVDGRDYYAHRLAWLIVTGAWPKRGEVDHKNRDRSDNSWDNLRPASISQQRVNRSLGKHNKSGHKGIYWSRRNERWIAEIKFEKSRHYIGSFKEKEDAIIAYLDVARKLHGDFSIYA